MQFDVRVGLKPKRKDLNLDDVSAFVAKALAAYAENHDTLGNVGPEDFEIRHVARQKPEPKVIEECTTET